MTLLVAICASGHLRASPSITSRSALSGKLIIRTNKVFHSLLLDTVSTREILFHKEKIEQKGEVTHEEETDCYCNLSCLVLAVAMAVPVFARYETYDIVRNDIDHIGYQMCLSLYSTRGAYNNCRLSTWNYEGSSDQLWEAKYNSNTGAYTMCVQTDPNYALNAYRVLKNDWDGNYYQADVYPYYQNPDAAVTFIRNLSYSYIKNITTGYYLTVSGRKTPAQPTDADSTSYYIDWYEKSFPVASEWRAAPIGP